MPASSIRAVPGPGARWRDRWFDWRNRMLASAAFQRLAVSFWPTRQLARARAAEVFDLVAGFVYSQVLLACVRLRLLDALVDGARTTDALATSMGLAAEPARRLLDAACALRLVERRCGDRWGLGMRGAPLANNEAVRAMVEHHAVLYRDLSDPVALLRGEAPAGLAAYWSYAGADDPAALATDTVRAYSRLMSASQPLVATELLRAYRFDRHRCVLDVGGGDGTFLQSLGAAHPHLQRMLFDLPAVTPLAAARLGPAVSLQAGDFLRDALPTGADVVTLVRILHDHDDASVRTLLGKVHACLPTGGAVVVGEPLARTRGAEAMGDAYFGFYLLAMGKGRPRTAQQLAGLLADAGFGDIRLRPTAFPLQASVLSAVRV